MVFFKDFSFFIFGLFSVSLYSCLCNEQYTLEVPIRIQNVRPNYQLGDTLIFEMIIDKKMVYDTINKEYYFIKDFNPYLKVQNVVIDSFPTIDDLDSVYIISNYNFYNLIYYNARNSYGMRIDAPYVKNDTIVVKIGLILQKIGKHMIYFDSPFDVIGDDIYFDGKCSNSYTDVYMHLIHGNNEYILSQEHKKVIDLHFENSAGMKYRSAKYYYNVVE